MNPVLIIMSACLICSCFAASSRHLNLTKEEDLELEKQLKSLNKPAIKIIESDGDVYHCVDIKKQPAFDHPLLKDHNLQYEPTPHPNMKLGSNSTLRVGLRDGGCPSGTVPIKKITKKILINNKRSIKYEKSSTATVADSSAGQNYINQWATFRTRPGKYYGASSYMNLYGLPGMTSGQYSSTGLWIVNDEYQDQINVISAGWTVDPDFYGDSRTRLWTSWSTDNFGATGCWDMHCSGFVQVNNRIPLGTSLSPLSIYNGKQYDFRVRVYQDPKTSHWWLVLGSQGVAVGYWPYHLFTRLGYWATWVQYGGFAGYYPNEGKPPMGSGHFPSEGQNRACYFRIVRYVDSQYHFVDLESGSVSTYVTLPQCYRTGSYLYGGQGWGYTFYFGGPGNC